VILPLFLAARFALAASDPCLSRCTLETGGGGSPADVICTCAGKTGHSSRILDARTRLRGASDAEIEIVEKDGCRENDGSPLCRCVIEQREFALARNCTKSGAGEAICRFEPSGEKLPAPRPALLRDYQTCIANRFNYRAASCYKGECSKLPDAYEGGVDPDEAKIKIDARFTPEERASVQTAVSAIPRCWAAILKGTKINRVPLWRAEVKNKQGVPTMLNCVAGEATLYQNNIDLDPNCGITVGVVVHELFHILGGRGGLGLRWKALVGGHRMCPVTPYGASNDDEDFAEAGRFLLYPNFDGFGAFKYDHKCIDGKLEALRRLLGGCGK
jgi:hypothetical protein